MAIEVSEPADEILLRDGGTGRVEQEATVVGRMVAPCHWVGTISLSKSRNTIGTFFAGSQGAIPVERDYEAHQHPGGWSRPGIEHLPYTEWDRPEIGWRPATIRQPLAHTFEVTGPVSTMDRVWDKDKRGWKWVSPDRPDKSPDDTVWVNERFIPGHPVRPEQLAEERLEIMRPWPELPEEIREPAADVPSEVWDGTED